MSKTNKQIPLDDDEVDAEVMVPNGNKVSNEIVKHHDKTDEIFITAEEKDKYMEKWLEVAYLIYSQVF
uniref:Uncharacterized protein n=1 Tax=Panagrolaimus davidi TaxID=227884 RepID=A0A914PQQ2_9BILA